MNETSRLFTTTERRERKSPYIYIYIIILLLSKRIIIYYYYYCYYYANGCFRRATWLSSVAGKVARTDNRQHESREVRPTDGRLPHTLARGQTRTAGESYKTDQKPVRPASVQDNRLRRSRHRKWPHRPISIPRSTPEAV